MTYGNANTGQLKTVEYGKATGPGGESVTGVKSGVTSYYSGPDGNVYKSSGDGWQKYDMAETGTTLKSPPWEAPRHRSRGQLRPIHLRQSNRPGYRGTSDQRRLPGVRINGEGDSANRRVLRQDLQGVASSEEAGTGVGASLGVEAGTGVESGGGESRSWGGGGWDRGGGGGRFRR